MTPTRVSDRLTESVCTKKAAKSRTCKVRICVNDAQLCTRSPYNAEIDRTYALAAVDNDEQVENVANGCKVLLFASFPLSFWLYFHHNTTRRRCGCVNSSQLELCEETKVYCVFSTCLLPYTSLPKIVEYFRRHFLCSQKHSNKHNPLPTSHKALTRHCDRL